MIEPHFGEIGIAEYIANRRVDASMDFDAPYSRKGSYSIKHDGLEEIFGLTGEDLLPLWVADMDFPSPPVVQAAIIKRAEQGAYGYVGGYQPQYKDIVSAWFAGRQDLHVDKRAFLVSDTIVAGINRMIRTFTQEGDKVIIQTPVYPPFHRAVINNNRELVYNPLKKTAAGYEMDYDDLSAKIDDKCKLLIFCSPHNPVGRVWRIEELERLWEICSRHNILIISDEAHADIVYSGNKHINFLNVAAQAKESVIVCTSPHKTFNMAGLHISNLIIPNEYLRHAYVRMLTREGYARPNIFALVACMAAYGQAAPWLDELLVYLEANRDFIARYLAREMPQIGYYKPEGTFLAWLDFSAFGLAGDKLQECILRQAKVVLNAGAMFGVEGNTFMRLNFACPRAQIERALERIKNALYCKVQ
ncbi:MAG: Cystathionine beta-lyase PatB [Pelotomaculum sp. PtaB.Bin117]|nr:MAG: Cystathionine beta-lyase PatB [Pelotomaculum sp. PtaB.Bin117]OPY63199.1 MAG: Cystathionine beta-lyase PatB [Pelotomaculum sp. PtaU1.Bin065]